MSLRIEIVPAIPFQDGVAIGREMGRAQVRQRIAELLKDRHLKATLGAMSRSQLFGLVKAKLETPPDYTRYPELEDIYPERLDYLRGFAKGAECSHDEAATADYLVYRQGIEAWYHSLQFQPTHRHCSGVLLVGPDGVIGAGSGETVPPTPAPKNYRWRAPRAYRGLKTLPAVHKDLVLRRPRTGYIESWGTTNERGVGCAAGVSCSTWLDEPIEDTWPISGFPLLRFARNIDHLAELYARYTLHAWGRASQVWADTSGNGMIVEKSFRRIAIRRIKDNVLWCTEGHFESPEMSAFIRARRLQYIERAGKHLGCEDMQYATDCAVRFTHMGELCYMPWGRGLEHMRRILTDHAPFPRAVCRHGGPDTAPYDRTLTLDSNISDFTHNRWYKRSWIPWKKFPCEVPEKVTQYPARP